MKSVRAACHAGVIAVTAAGAMTMLLAGCASSQGTTMSERAAMNTLTPAEQSAGWKLLFDGKTLNGWHVFRKTGAPTGWEAADGELRWTSNVGDLVTNDMYGNFELALDWKISPGGNSGIIYHVTNDGSETYETGPEMQLLDDARHPDGKSLLTSAGSDFGLYPVSRRMAKPAGEWNSARVIVNGAHVEHWLNGVKVVEYELWSPDWKQRVANSKFRHWPQYGLAKSGYIALQNHEFPVTFRNIRIRVLP